MTGLEGYVDCASEDPVPYVIESPIHRMEIILFCPFIIYVTSEIMIKTENESNKRSSRMPNGMRMHWYTFLKTSTVTSETATRNRLLYLSPRF
jgi:hypothetical protein